MQLVTRLEDLQLPQPAGLTLGVFDGVHRGHQALIAGLVAQARAAGRSAVAVAFQPHPSAVLRAPRPRFYLTLPETRAQLLGALGLDAVVMYPFTREVAQIRAADFVQQLVTHARLQSLWCGQGFALGHNREGDVTFLRAAGERLGFSVHVPAPVLLDGQPVSSTRVRRAVWAGEVTEAARLLGRPFSLIGPVVSGAHRGRTLGIPTANLAVDDDHALPATGVYAGRLLHAGGVYPAVANVGYRPTFETGEPAPTVEAHLLGFSGDLYGARVTLEFIAHLRPEMKFAGVEALKTQIQQDIARARELLAHSE